MNQPKDVNTLVQELDELCSRSSFAQAFSPQHLHELAQGPLKLGTNSSKVNEPIDRSPLSREILGHSYNEFITSQHVALMNWFESDPTFESGGSRSTQAAVVGVKRPENATKVDRILLDPVLKHLGQNGQVVLQTALKNSPFFKPLRRKSRRRRRSSHSKSIDEPETILSVENAIQVANERFDIAINQLANIAIEEKSLVGILIVCKVLCCLWFAEGASTDPAGANQTTKHREAVARKLIDGPLHLINNTQTPRFQDILNRYQVARGGTVALQLGFPRSQVAQMITDALPDSSLPEERYATVPTVEYGGSATGGVGINLTVLGGDANVNQLSGLVCHENPFGEQHRLRALGTLQRSHPGVRCDGCVKYEDSIRGPRFKCVECHDTDFCLDCFLEGQHDMSHSFDVIFTSGGAKNRIPPRNTMSTCAVIAPSIDCSRTLDTQDSCYYFEVSVNIAYGNQYIGFCTSPAKTHIGAGQEVAQKPSACLEVADTTAASSSTGVKHESIHESSETSKEGSGDGTNDRKEDITELNLLEKYCNGSNGIPGVESSSPAAVVFNAKQKRVYSGGISSKVHVEGQSHSDTTCTSESHSSEGLIPKSDSNENDVNKDHSKGSISNDDNKGSVSNDSNANPVGNNSKAEEKGADSNCLFPDGEHNLKAGDVVGCWFNPTTRSVGFSLNGNRVVESFELQIDDPNTIVFPVIGMQCQMVPNGGDKRFPRPVATTRSHRQRFESNASSMSESSSEESSNEHGTLDAATLTSLNTSMVVNFGQSEFKYPPVPSPNKVVVNSVEPSESQANLGEEHSNAAMFRYCKPNCVRFQGFGSIESRASDGDPSRMNSGFTFETMALWEPQQYCTSDSASQFYPLFVSCASTGDATDSEEGELHQSVAFGIACDGKLALRKLKGNFEVVSEVITDDHVVSPGVWHHVAVTGTPFKTKYFVDGNQVASLTASVFQTVSHCISAKGRVFLGGFPQGSVAQSNSNGFVGCLASARIVCRAMSPLRLRKCGGRILNADWDEQTFALWPLDEAGGLVAHALGGSVTHGVLHGDARFEVVELCEFKQQQLLSTEDYSVSAKGDIDSMVEKSSSERDSSHRKHGHHSTLRAHEHHSTLRAHEHHSTLRAHEHHSTIPNVILFLLENLSRIANGYHTCTTSQPNFGGQIQLPTVAVAPNALSILLLHSLTSQVFKFLQQDGLSTKKHEQVGKGLVYLLNIFAVNLIALRQLQTPATSIGLGASPGGKNNSQVLKLRSLLLDIVQFCSKRKEKDKANQQVATSALAVLGHGFEVFYPEIATRQRVLWCLLDTKQTRMDRSPSDASNGEHGHEALEEFELQDQTGTIESIGDDGAMTLLSLLCRRLEQGVESFVRMLKDPAKSLEGKSGALPKHVALKWPSHHVVNSLQGNADNILAEAAATANSGGQALTKREVVKYMREVAPSEWLETHNLNGNETAIVKLMTNDTIAQKYIVLEREYPSLDKERQTPDTVATNSDMLTKTSLAKSNITDEGVFSLMKLVTKFNRYLIDRVGHISACKSAAFDIKLGIKCASSLLQVARGEATMTPAQFPHRVASDFVQFVLAHRFRYVKKLGISCCTDSPSTCNPVAFWQTCETDTSGLDATTQGGADSTSTVQHLEFDTSQAPRSFRISNNGTQCRQQSAKTWRTVIARHGIRRNTGIHRWSVTVNDVNHRGHMFVGVASSRVRKDSFLGRDDQGYGILLAGDVYHKGSPAKLHMFRRGLLKKGSVIVLELNSDAGTLSLSLASGSQRSLGIVLDQTIVQHSIFDVHESQLFPAVCLYDEGDEVTLSGCVEQGENGPHVFLANLDEKDQNDRNLPESGTADISAATFSRPSAVKVNGMTIFEFQGPPSFLSLLQFVLTSVIGKRMVFNSDLSDDVLVSYLSGTVIPVIATGCLWNDFNTVWATRNVTVVKTALFDIQATREEVAMNSLHDSISCQQLKCTLCKCLLEVEVLLSYLHSRLCATLIASVPEVDNDLLLESKGSAMIHESEMQITSLESKTSSSSTLVNMEHNLQWCSKGLLLQGLRRNPDCKYVNNTHRASHGGTHDRSQGNNELPVAREARRIQLMKSFLEHPPSFLFIHHWVLRHLSFQPPKIIHFGGPKLEKATLAVVVIMLWHSSALEFVQEIGTILKTAVQKAKPATTSQDHKLQSVQIKALHDLVDAHPTVRPPALLNEIWKVSMQVKSWLIRFASLNQSQSEDAADLLLNHVWLLLDLSPCLSSLAEANLSPYEKENCVARISHAFLGKSVKESSSTVEECSANNNKERKTVVQNLKLAPPSLNRADSAPTLLNRLKGTQKLSSGMKPLPLSKSWSLRSQRSTGSNVSGTSIAGGGKCRVSRKSMSLKTIAQQVTLFLSDAVSGKIDPRVIHTLMISRSQCALRRETGLRAACSIFQGLPLSAQLVPVHAAALVPLSAALRGHRNAWNSPNLRVNHGEHVPSSPSSKESEKLWHYTDNLDSAGWFRMREVLPEAFSQLALALVRALQAFTSAGGRHTAALQLGILRTFGMNIKSVDHEMLARSSLFSILHRTLVECRQRIQEIVTEEEVLAASLDRSQSEQDGEGNVTQVLQGLGKNRLELKLVSRATMKLVFLLCSQVTQAVSIQDTRMLDVSLNLSGGQSNHVSGPETLSVSVFEMLYDEMSVAADDVFSSIDISSSAVFDNDEQVSSNKNIVSTDHITQEALHQLSEMASLLLSVSTYHQCVTLMTSERWVTLLLNLFQHGPTKIVCISSQLLRRILVRCPPSKFRLETEMLESWQGLHDSINGSNDNHSRTLVTWLLYQVSLPLHKLLLKDSDSVMDNCDTLLAYQSIGILRILAKAPTWSEVVLGVLKETLQCTHNPQLVEHDRVQLVAAFAVLGGDMTGLHQGGVVKLHREDSSPCETGVIDSDLQLNPSQHISELSKLPITVHHVCRDGLSVSNQVFVRQCEATPVALQLLPPQYIPDDIVQEVVHACEVIFSSKPLPSLDDDKTLFYQVVWTSDAVKIRTHPREDSESIGYKQAGTIVCATEVNGDWIKLAVSAEYYDGDMTKEAWLMVRDSSGTVYLAPCDPSGRHFDDECDALVDVSDDAACIVEKGDPCSSNAANKIVVPKVPITISEFISNCLQVSALKSLTNLQTHPQLVSLVIRGEAKALQSILPTMMHRACKLTTTYGIMDLPALEERLHIITEVLGRPDIERKQQSEDNEEDEAAVKDGVVPSSSMDDDAPSSSAESDNISTEGNARQKRGDSATSNGLRPIEEANETAQDSAMGPLVTSIIEMGFPQHWATIALAETGDVMSAINWIVSNGELLEGMSASQVMSDDGVDDEETGNYYCLGGTTSESGAPEGYDDDQESNSAQVPIASSHGTEWNQNGTDAEHVELPQVEDYFESNQGAGAFETPGKGTSISREAHSGWLDNGHGDSLSFLRFGNSVLHSDRSVKETVHSNLCDLSLDHLPLSSSNDSSLQNRMNRVWFPVAASRQNYCRALMRSPRELVLHESEFVIKTITTLRCRMFVLFLITQACRDESSPVSNAWDRTMQLFAADSDMESCSIMRHIVWLLQISSFKLFPFYAEDQLSLLCRMLSVHPNQNSDVLILESSQRQQKLSLPLCIMDIIEKLMQDSPEFADSLVQVCGEQLKIMGSTGHSENVERSGALIRSYDRSMDIGPCLWFVEWCSYLVIHQKLVEISSPSPHGIQLCHQLLMQSLRLLSSAHMGVKYQALRLISLHIRTCQSLLVGMEGKCDKPGHQMILQHARSLLNAIAKERLHAMAASRLYTEGDLSPWFSSYLQHLIDICSGIEACESIVTSLEQQESGKLEHESNEQSKEVVVPNKSNFKAVELQESKSWLDIVGPSQLNHHASGMHFTSDSATGEPEDLQSSLCPPWTFNVVLNSKPDLPDQSYNRVLLFAQHEWTSCIEIYLTASSLIPKSNQINSAVVLQPSEAAHDTSEPPTSTTEDNVSQAGNKVESNDKPVRTISSGIQEGTKDDPVKQQSQNSTSVHVRRIGIRYKGKVLLFPSSVPCEEWVQLSFTCSFGSPIQTSDDADQYFVTLFINGEVQGTIPVSNGEHAFLPLRAIGSPEHALRASIARASCWDCELSADLLKRLARTPTTSVAILGLHQIMNLEMNKVKASINDSRTSLPYIARPFIPDSSPHCGIHGAILCDAASVKEVQLENESSQEDLSDLNILQLLKCYSRFGTDEAKLHVESSMVLEDQQQTILKEASKDSLRRLEVMQHGVRMVGVMKYDPEKMMPLVFRERLDGVLNKEVLQSFVLFCRAVEGSESKIPTLPLLGVMEWDIGLNECGALVSGTINVNTGRCRLRMVHGLYGTSVSPVMTQTWMFQGRESRSGGLEGEWVCLRQARILKPLEDGKMRFVLRRDSMSDAVRYLNNATCVTSGAPSSQHAIVPIEFGTPAGEGLEESAEQVLQVGFSKESEVNSDELDSNCSDSDDSKSELSVHENSTTWSCEVCTFINDGDMTSCAMCTAANPTPAVSQEKSSSVPFSGQTLIQEGTGVWRWECKVMRGVAPSSGVSVGVCEADVNLAGRLGEDSHGWGLQSHNGNSRHSDLSRGYLGQPLVSGDIITVELDSDAKTLSFYLNNKSYGVAFRESDGILRNPLTPCASVYRVGESVELLGLKQGHCCVEFHSLDQRKWAKYDGEWKDGKMDGLGKLTLYDGTTYTGPWKQDKRVGIHVVRRPIVRKTSDEQGKSEKKVKATQQQEQSGTENSDSESSDNESSSSSSSTSEESESEHEVDQTVVTTAAANPDVANDSNSGKEISQLKSSNVVYKRFSDGEENDATREEYLKQQEEHKWPVFDAIPVSMDVDGTRKDSVPSTEDAQVPNNNGSTPTNASESTPTNVTDQCDETTTLLSKPKPASADVVVPDNQAVAASEMKDNLAVEESGKNQASVVKSNKVDEGSFVKSVRCGGTLSASTDSLFVLDSKTAGPGLEVSEDGLTVELKRKQSSVGSSSSRSHVLGSRGFSAGVHYWEMKVLGVERGSTYIGIAETSKVRTRQRRRISLAQQESRTSLFSSVNETGMKSTSSLDRLSSAKATRTGEGWGGGYGFVNYRATHGPQGEQLYGTFYGAGDTVGVLLDMDCGRLSFVKRGRDFSEKEVVIDLGLAYGNIRESRSSSFSGSGLWPTTFYPCVGFSRRGDKITLKNAKHFSFYRQTSKQLVSEAILTASLLKQWQLPSRDQDSSGPCNVVGPSIQSMVSSGLVGEAYGLFKNLKESRVQRLRALGGMWFEVSVENLSEWLPEELGATAGTRISTERGFANLLGVHRDCVWYQVETETFPTYWHPKELRKLVRKGVVSVAPDENKLTDTNSGKTGEAKPVIMCLDDFVNVISNRTTGWTVKHDEVLVSKVNNRCDQLGCDPLQLPCDEIVLLLRSGPVDTHEAALADFSSDEILVRFSILLALNLRFEQMLPLVDLNVSAIGVTEVVPTYSASDCTSRGEGVYERATNKVRVQMRNATWLNLGQLVSRLRGIIFTRNKLSFWNDQVKSTETYTNLNPDEYEKPPDIPDIQVNRIRASQHQLVGLPAQTRLARSVFGQLLLETRMGEWDPSRLRRSYIHPQDVGQPRCFFVKFESEGVDDHGGPYRALFQLAAEEEPTGALGIVVPCPNASDGGMINRDKMVFSGFGKHYQANDDYDDGDTSTDKSVSASTPNSKSQRSSASEEITCTPGDLRTCDLFGKLVGVAIRHGMLVGLDLPHLIWRPLVGLDVSIKDLYDVDTFTANSLRHIEMMSKEQWKEAEADWSSLLWEKIGGSPPAQPVWYMPESNGRNATTMEDMPVSDDVESGQRLISYEDRGVITRRILREYLESSALQLEAFTEGLSQVIPTCSFSLFTPNELEALVCGRPEINVELLKQVTEYENIDVDSKHVGYFWDALESMTQAERSSFINFVCARSRLPNSADKFPMNFKIQGVAGGGDDELPRSQTCFFSLSLPAYSSAQVCKDKLIYASENCNTMEDFDAHEATGFEHLE